MKLGPPSISTMYAEWSESRDMPSMLVDSFLIESRFFLLGFHGGQNVVH